MSILKKQKGISTIEIIVTVIITLTVFTLIISIYLLGQRTFRETGEYAELVQNARVTLDRLARELRQTPEIVTYIPDPELAEPAAHEIEFQDGHDMTEIKYIRYYLNGSDLYRQIKAYYFPSLPEVYVHWNDEDEFGTPPEISLLEDRIVGEYITNIDFIDYPVVNIVETLTKNDKQVVIMTYIYGRNL